MAFLARYSLLPLLIIASSVLAEPMPLKSVRTYMIQIQGLDNRKAIEALAASDYDLLIIDALNTAKGGEGVDMKGMVASLRARKPGRVVLAYFDIGAAESDRVYWGRNWVAPTAK